MADLVMLDLAPGPDFVVALQRCWDRGAACFPLDQRLPEAEASLVASIVRPTHVIDAGGQTRTLAGGLPVEAGDAVVVATSGTTGTPKAVIHTHDGVLASSEATSAALDVDPRTDCWLACLPPAHIGGLAVIMRALHTNTPLVVHEQFDAEATDRAAREGATLVSVVTRALNQIDVTGFRTILIGGAAPPPDLPAHVIPTWGMTETGSGCVYGGYPLDGVELRANSSGEIEVRAPLLLRGYRTTDGFVDPFLDDGWFPTGDLGRIDDDGRLWIDGRAGDMVITGGENVHPARTERRLLDHPNIAEAAVIGRPDPQWGHQLVAVIVAHDDAPNLDEVRDWVRAELPAWYAPRALDVRDALPKTALGKIRKDQL